MIRKPFSLAAAAVSALAIVTLGMGGGTAFADDTDQSSVGGSPQAATNPALINPAATVALTIQKHLGAPTGQPNNGTVQNVTTPKLQGVDFDVYQVQYLTQPATWFNVDLTTNDGWDLAAKVQGATPGADGTFTIDETQFRIVKISTVTTDSTGTATFTKTNGVGLYFVKENLATSGTITNLATNTTVEASTITPSAPFFVTLPMTNPDSLNSWMYDVRVYPKNQSDTITKKVNDEATYTVGKAISYTLESTISPIEKLGYYYIADSNEYLTATGVSVSVSGQTLKGCDGTAAAGSGCDYVYWLDADTATGSQVKVAFTEAGLTKLEAAKKANDNAMVTTSISGTILSVPATGVVPNQGSFIPSSTWYANNGGTTPVTPPPTDPTAPVTPPTPEVPGIPSNEVKSYFGNITVDKQLTGGAANDTAVGAEFAVYVDPTPTTSCTAADVEGTALATKAITEGNTVTFEPLRASNWADNAELADSSATGWLQYCVVETKAPDGYNLNAEPFTATINWATGTTTLTRTAEVQITNEKSNLGNELPLTGGEGIAALSLGGLALIGGGAGYYALTSRKRREA